jgi:hypothetical protein
MDLSKISTGDAGDFELLHPIDQTKTGVIFQLAGPNHPKRKAQKYSFERALTQRVNRTGKLSIEDPEIRHERETEFLVACTLGWSSLDMNGQSYPFSTENAKRLYEDEERDYVREQILEALKSNALFIRSSATA